LPVFSDEKEAAMKNGGLFFSCFEMKIKRGILELLTKIAKASVAFF
jgi:hypothetical protein